MTSFFVPRNIRSVPTELLRRADIIISSTGEVLKDRFDCIPKMAKILVVEACKHERLNEEGICRKCGADCRGIPE